LREREREKTEEGAGRGNPQPTLRIYDHWSYFASKKVRFYAEIGKSGGGEKASPKRGFLLLST
jgi:hypothetical protein